MRPSTMRSSTVFPAPLPPMTASVVPLSSAKLTPEHIGGGEGLQTS